MTTKHCCLIVTLFAVLCGGKAEGAEPTVGGDAELLIAFRMRDWKTTHLHDAEQVAKHEQALKQLGCEIKKSQHNGHIDVACRTIYWKSLALQSPEQLQSWQTWLQQIGFETIHGRPVPSTPEDAAGRELVQYRLPDWKVLHLHQPQEVGQKTTLYRALGCEVTTSQHNGHSDLKLRCSEWHEIELSTHEAAHQWQKFLNQAGFETRHEH